MAPSLARTRSITRLLYASGRTPSGPVSPMTLTVSETGPPERRASAWISLAGKPTDTCAPKRTASSRGLEKRPTTCRCGYMRCKQAHGLEELEVPGFAVEHFGDRPARRIGGRRSLPKGGYIRIFRPARGGHCLSTSFRWRERTRS